MAVSKKFLETTKKQKQKDLEVSLKEIMKFDHKFFIMAGWNGESSSNPGVKFSQLIDKVTPKEIEVILAKTLEKAMKESEETV